MNGNQITDGGVFFPITPSTEMGESCQSSFAEGKRTVNFTSGRNIRLE